MAGFAYGAQALFFIVSAFIQARREVAMRRRACQWWVSGRSPEGTQRHYLLRV